jgi:hypothetical protein
MALSQHDAHQRALDHWSLDGALELALGALLVGASLILFVHAEHPRPIWTVALVLWIMTGSWLARRWITAVKMKRAAGEGYVSFRRPGSRKVPELAMAVAVLVIAYTAYAGSPLVVTAVTGGLQCTALLLMVLRTHSRRIALVTLAAGMGWVQALFTVPVYPRNISMMLVVTGLAFLIIGVRARLERAYHPAPPPEHV